MHSPEISSKKIQGIDQYRVAVCKYRNLWRKLWIMSNLRIFVVGTSAIAHASVEHRLGDLLHVSLLSLHIKFMLYVINVFFIIVTFHTWTPCKCRTI